jgi:hypothetical protein
MVMQDNSQTQFEDRILWPGVCPHCGYSWKGLPGPRCPECGEQVVAEEIVLVGRSLQQRKGGFTGEYWGKEILECAGCAAFAAIVGWLLRGRDPMMFVIGGGLFLFLGAMTTVVAIFQKRRGRPLGVLRLSAQGFRIGAGAKAGI